MDGRVLLEAVLAAPDDPAPRLVYADWLLERGDVRGELIHLQIDCEREELSEGDYNTMFQRGEALVEEHDRKWTKEIRGCAMSWWFDRGFPDHVQTTCAKLIAKGDRLAAATPLRHVTITKWPTKAVAETLARAAVLGRVHELCLRGAATEAAAKILFASPHLAKLPALEIDSAIAARGIAKLPALRSLSVGNTIHGQGHLGDDPVDAKWIAGLAKAAPPLRRLVLFDQKLGKDGLDALVASPLLKQLEALTLYACGAGAAVEKKLRAKLPKKAEIWIEK
jgi:uncharacterized protein (TIGR02996 family)